MSTLWLEIFWKDYTNGTKNIKVEISLVESYIEQGYVLGRIKI